MTRQSHQTCDHANTKDARLKCRMTVTEIAAYRLERNWARVFGGTRELFNQKWNEQQGRCAICHREMIVGKMASTEACFDHCHKQRIPRGILCRRCNILLGWFEKFPFDIVRYVQHYEGGNTVDGELL